MKAPFTLAAVLILIAGIAGAIWHRQRVRDAAVQQRAAALHSEVEALKSELNESRVSEQQKPAPIEAKVPARANPAPASSPAPAVTKAAPNPAMLNDPETRALMQKQQAQALARLADKIVSKDFARQWNLTPEQVSQVKELVRERASAGKDLLTAMMFDGLDDAALAERGRETKQRLERADEALRELLGQDGLTAVRDRERHLEDGERMKRIREDLAAAEQPLTKEQQESLIAAMGVERQAFSFRVDYSDPSKVDFEHIRDHFSEANLQIHFEDMQQLNARITERAALFLSPEQIEQLKTIQNNHLEQARITVKMTTELFNKRRTN